MRSGAGLRVGHGLQRRAGRTARVPRGERTQPATRCRDDRLQQGAAGVCGRSLRLVVCERARRDAAPSRRYPPLPEELQGRGRKADPRGILPACRAAAAFRQLRVGPHRLAGEASAETPCRWRTTGLRKVRLPAVRSFRLRDTQTHGCAARPARPHPRCARNACAPSKATRARVSSVSVSPDGRRAVSGSEDRHRPGLGPGDRPVPAHASKATAAGSGA